MDTLRPMDLSTATETVGKQEVGSAPVNRVETLAEVGSQLDVADQAAATVARSLTENRAVLDVARKGAPGIDQDAVTALADQVKEQRYLLNVSDVVNRLMEDSGILLPATADSE